MLNICWRYRYGMLLQLSTLPTDMEGATTFENIVNLIGAGMRVRLLLLARLKTVEITEHALGLKQVHFLHLLLIKSLLTEDIFGIHTILHLCERLHTRPPGVCSKTHCRKSFACCLCLQNPWKPVVNVSDRPLESYIGQ